MTRFRISLVAHPLKEKLCKRAKFRHKNSNKEQNNLRRFNTLTFTLIICSLTGEITVLATSTFNSSLKIANSAMSKKKQKKNI